MTQLSGVHDSDDEFETHSFSDEYSPTDGFSSRDHPQDLFVQSRTTSSKDEEAATTTTEESSTSSSSSRYVAHECKIPSSQSRPNGDERMPLLYDAPPPAYSATQYSSTQYSSAQSLYEAPSPLPERDAQVTTNTPFFQEGEPQSMGNAIARFDTERNYYIRPARSRMSRICSMLCQITVAFIGVLILLWIGYVASNSSNKNRLPDSEYTDPVMPAMPSLPSWCGEGTVKAMSFAFEDPSSFTFAEEMSTSDFSGGIYGRIRLEEGDWPEDSQIRVNISVSMSEPYKITDLQYTKTDDHLTLNTPTFQLGSAGVDVYRKGCMAVATTIYFKKGLSLSQLNVKTHILEIILASGLELALKQADLEATAGKVSSEAKLFESRDTRIHVGSGSISGHYNLLDLLSIDTRSGSINVDVTPKAADKEKTKPATLQLRTGSGSINVLMPSRDSATKIPDRDYQTSIKGGTGSVSGRVIHGTSTHVESYSGSISVDVLPYAADDYSSTLYSKSMSGTTHINVASPHKSGTIRRMESSHSTQTGSLNIAYPQEWEGKMSGSTTTGTLVLRGKDVVVDEYDEGWVSKSVKAHKGEHDLKGKLDFTSRTGSVDVTIGDISSSSVARRSCGSVFDAFEEIWRDIS